jgi:AcrR family transcriptional regulator
MYWRMTAQAAHTTAGELQRAEEYEGNSASLSADLQSPLCRRLRLVKNLTINKYLIAVKYLDNVVGVDSPDDSFEIRKRRRYTQAERRALSDKRMLDAAVKFIARQGSNRTTLAEIGDTAGYTYGLVTNRFGSKAGLVRAVTRYVQSRFARRAVPEVGNASGIDAIKLLIDAYLNKVDSVGRRALLVLVGEAIGPVPEIRPDIARADESFRRSLQGHIDRGIASGEIKPQLDAARQAALLVATLRGISLQSLINPVALDLQAISRDLQANVETIFRRTPGSAFDSAIQ